MNALTDLAITYNDVSPLENHHCGISLCNLAVLFAILRHPDCNILSNLTTSEYKDVRKLAISCILATDMGKHSEFVSRLKDSSATFSLDDVNHRLLVLSCLC